MKSKVARARGAPGGAQGWVADAAARAAGWIHAAVHRCAEGACEGGAASGQGGREQGRAVEGDGWKGGGCWAHKRCMCFLLGVAARPRTGSVLSRVGEACSLVNGRESRWLTSAPGAGRKLVSRAALQPPECRIKSIDSGHTPHFLDRREIPFELTKASDLSRAGYTCTARAHSVRPRSVLDYGGLGRT